MTLASRVHPFDHEKFILPWDDPTSFAIWLSSLNDNDVAGWVCKSAECPLALFFNAISPEKHEFEVFNSGLLQVVFNRSRSRTKANRHIPFEIVKKTTIELPNWHINFINALDNIDSRWMTQHRHRTVDKSEIFDLIKDNCRLATGIRDFREWVSSEVSAYAQAGDFVPSTFDKNYNHN